MKQVSRLNDAHNYTNVHADCGFDRQRVHDKAAYATDDNETVNRIMAPYCHTPVERICSMLDEMDIAIIEEVARSKYLVSIQIYQYLGLRGFRLQRSGLRNRINKMVKFHILREYEIARQGAETGLRYYELGGIGFLIARERGVVFHKGNRFLKEQTKIDQGIVEDPVKVKRVLAANMVILGLLRNGVAMDGFAFNETVRPAKDGPITDNCILRTQGMFWIGQDSVFLVEAVRSTPNGMRKIADKVSRYYALVNSDAYLAENAHGHRSLPQLILCAESLEHAQKIDAYLRRKGLWSGTDTILYTHDLLYMKDTLRTFYELAEDGTQAWYSLPSRYVPQEMCCA